MNNTQYICDVCLRIFNENEINQDSPLCADCDSEGIGSRPVPLEGFLQNKTKANFEEMQKHLEAGKDQFVPSYFELLKARIQALIDILGPM